MSGFRGVLVGALTLIALQTIVSTQGAANRTAGLMHDVATLLNKLLDPAVPFFADHSRPDAPAAAASTSATTTVAATAPTPAIVPALLRTTAPARPPTPATPAPSGAVINA